MNGKQMQGLFTVLRQNMACSICLLISVLGSIFVALGKHLLFEGAIVTTRYAHHEQRRPAWVVKIPPVNHNNNVRLQETSRKLRKTLADVDNQFSCVYERLEVDQMCIFQGYNIGCETLSISIRFQESTFSAWLYVDLTAAQVPGTERLKELGNDAFIRKNPGSQSYELCICKGDAVLSLSGRDEAVGHKCAAAILTHVLDAGNSQGSPINASFQSNRMHAFPYFTPAQRPTSKAPSQRHDISPGTEVVRP